MLAAWKRHQLRQGIGDCASKKLGNDDRYLQGVYEGAKYIYNHGYQDLQSFEQHPVQDLQKLGSDVVSYGEGQLKSTLEGDATGMVSKALGFGGSNPIDGIVKSVVGKGISDGVSAVGKAMSGGDDDGGAPPSSSAPDDDVFGGWLRRRLTGAANTEDDHETTKRILQSGGAGFQASRLTSGMLLNASRALNASYAYSILKGELWQDIGDRAP